MREQVYSAAVVTSGLTDILVRDDIYRSRIQDNITRLHVVGANTLLSGVPDYFCRNKISSGGDLSHYSSASLY